MAFFFRVVSGPSAWSISAAMLMVAAPLGAGADSLWHQRAQARHGATPERVASSVDAGQDNGVSAVVPKGSLLKARRRQLMVGGVSRSYLIQTVEAGGGPYPVVVILHGGTNTDAQVWRQTSLPTLGQSQGFIVVAPQGIDKQWNDGRDATISGTASNADDLAFLHALIQAVVARDHGDARAVFMVGASNGGFMTMHFACHHAQDLAAAASVAADLPTHEAEQCHPGKPLPWLFMNGTNDPLIPFLGEPEGTVKNGHSQPALLSADASFAFWADHAQCQPAVKTHLLPTSSGNDEAERRVRSGCVGQTESVQYVFKGSGHNWPGLRNGPVVKLLGGSSQTVDAGSAIWSFFRQALPR